MDSGYNAEIFYCDENVIVITVGNYNMCVSYY